MSDLNAKLMNWFFVYIHFFYYNFVAKNRHPIAINNIH